MITSQSASHSPHNGETIGSVHARLDSPWDRKKGGPYLEIAANVLTLHGKLRETTALRKLRAKNFSVLFVLSPFRLCVAIPEGAHFTRFSGEKLFIDYRELRTHDNGTRSHYRVIAFYSAEHSLRGTSSTFFKKIHPS